MQSWHSECGKATAKRERNGGLAGGVAVTIGATVSQVPMHAHLMAQHSLPLGKLFSSNQLLKYGCAKSIWHSLDLAWP